MGNSMDPVHIEHSADTMHVVLEAALGIRDARVLHEKLDTVLAGFTRAAREHGLALTWQSPSPVLRQAARALGFESILEMAS